MLSSTELVANITIAGDATLAFWDVQIALIGGKNGVGSEMFEITSAQILGSGTPGPTVGALARGTTCCRSSEARTAARLDRSHGVYDDQLGMVNLGSGDARGVDPLGTVALGSNGNSAATAWARQPNNSWSAQLLPASTGSVGGKVTSANRLAGGTLLAVGWQEFSGSRNTTERIPVAWQLGASGVWSAPQPYVVPSGLAGLQATDVNAAGQTVGMNDSGVGIVWETPTTYTVLDGTRSPSMRRGR